MHSVLLHRVKHTQDVQKEVDDVQVEVDGGQDVLLGGQLLHQQVGVIDDKATENQSSGSSKDQLCAVAVEKELKRAQSLCEMRGMCDGTEHGPANVKVGISVHHRMATSMWLILLYSLQSWAAYLIQTSYSL